VLRRKSKVASGEMGRYFFAFHMGRGINKIRLTATASTGTTAFGKM